MRRDRGRKPRRKVCVFCADHIDQIDYKDVAKLRRFTTERGKILPRRISGTCAKHQRKLTTSIKRARAIALLPIIDESRRYNHLVVPPFCVLWNGYIILMILFF